MDIQTAVTTCFRKYANFDGRASRSEFWYFWLFQVLLYVGLSILSAISEIFALFSLLAMLGLFVPSIAVAARRLHDIGKSGWLQLVAIIPLVGIFICLFWYVQPSEGAANTYGAAPA